LADGAGNRLLVSPVALNLAKPAYPSLKSGKRRFILNLLRLAVFREKSPKVGEKTGFFAWWKFLQGLTRVL
jgi:hypothetical protein